MYEDTMPSSLDKVYLSNSLAAAIELDEQLDFHPDDPNKGDSLPRRIGSVADELVSKNIRPGIVGRLIYEPNLWESLGPRQTCLALLSVQDVFIETFIFIAGSSRNDFFEYFSLWAPENQKSMSPLAFAGQLLKLRISVETEGAGKDWTQYRPTVEELKGMAIFGALMDPSCWPSELNLNDDILSKRTFKSYYFSNWFFHLLDAHYQRDIRNEWYFFRYQECYQKYDYILKGMMDSKLMKAERERLGALKPMRDYVYPDGIEALQKKFGLS